MSDRDEGAVLIKGKRSTDDMVIVAMALRPGRAGTGHRDDDRPNCRALARSAVFVCALGFSLPRSGLYAFPTTRHRPIRILRLPWGGDYAVSWLVRGRNRTANTIPIEVALNGAPASLISIPLDFRPQRHQGLLRFGTQYFFDRQEASIVLRPLVFLKSAASLSPWWAIAEIYRYELAGGRKDEPQPTSKTFKTGSCAGIQTGTGSHRCDGVRSTTQEYTVDIDPRKLISYGVSLPQVMEALTNSNANVGGKLSDRRGAKL